MATIRELIDEKIKILRKADVLSPAQLAMEAIELSSLLASVRVELVDREMAYNLVRKSLIVEYGTAAKAKVFAEATLEYRELIEGKAYLDSTIEMLRVCKRSVALAESELRESQH